MRRFLTVLTLAIGMVAAAGWGLREHSGAAAQTSGSAPAPEPAPEPATEPSPEPSPEPPNADKADRSEPLDPDAEDSEKAPAPETKGDRMDLETLGESLKKLVPGVQGGRQGRIGSWSMKLRGRTLYVIADGNANRMRIMTPVAEIDSAEDHELAFTLLEANFNRALDARYAINKDVIWSCFLHPLSSLTEADLGNGLMQVFTLAETTGTTYTSSGLVFGGDDEEEQEGSEPGDPDDRDGGDTGDRKRDNPTPPNPNGNGKPRRDGVDA